MTSEYIVKLAYMFCFQLVLGLRAGDEMQVPVLTEALIVSYS